MTANKQLEPAASNLESAATQTRTTACLGKKRDVAQMQGVSLRTVDNQLAAGMPHLKMGKRCVRFDLAEVTAWLKSQYGTQRIGKAND